MAKQLTEDQQTKILALATTIELDGTTDYKRILVDLGEMGIHANSKLVYAVLNKAQSLAEEIDTGFLD